MRHKHLELFRAVMQHGGITKAAEALGISQPYVSRSIARLEDELGFSLFERGYGHATPTHEGRAFSIEVERSYVGLDHLRSVAVQIRNEGGRPLHIFSQPSVAHHILPKAIRLLKVEFPDMRVVVQVASPEAIWESVASGASDVGISRPVAGYDDILYEPFLEVAAVCALPRGHALAHRGTLDLADLVDEVLIASASAHCQQMVELAFLRVGIKPRFHFEVQYTIPRCGLVSEGLGLAIVDPIAAAQNNDEGVVFRPLQPKILLSTVILRSTVKRPTVRMERLISVLRCQEDTRSAHFTRW